MCAQCGNPFHVAAATDGGVSDFVPTVDLDPIQAGAQITRHNFHWGSTLGVAAGPITFGFRSTAPTYNSSSDEQGTFSQFSAQEMAAAEYAMKMWANLANISFTEVSAGGYTNNATILFGNYHSTTDNSQAFTYYPTTNNQTSVSSQGDVWLNINYEHTTNLFAGSYDLLTLIHEIGHALGLEHPGSYNAGPGQTITYGNNAQYVEDSRQYSVMSYFDAFNTGANHVYNGQTIYASTPLLDDITAIQRLYGSNTSYAAGNTTYGFHSNADAAFQLSSSTQQVVFAIWDGGGNDTLDFSGYSTNQVIDLVPGEFSSIGALTLNVAIALGTIIENAIGGSGNDIIYQNSANNVINGGPGTDTLVFTGTHLQYQTLFNPDGSITLSDARSGSPDGTDTVTGIEYLSFSDGVFSIDQIAPPAFHSVVQLDTGDSNPWSSITTLLDGQNNIYQIDYVYDDGSKQHFLYDPLNHETWSDSEVDYDSQGHTTLVNYNYDDGTHFLRIYDVANQERYADVELFYYGDPYRPITVTYNFDDGTHKLYDYEVGNQTSTLSDIWELDAQNRRTSVLYQYADGSSILYEYDVTGQQSYSSIVWNFDSSGSRTALTYVERDGSQIIYSYDPHNLYPWSSSVAYKDASGHVTSQTVISDDGATSSSIAASHSFQFADLATPAPMESAEAMTVTSSQLTTSFGMATALSHIDVLSSALLDTETWHADPLKMTFPSDFHLH